MKVCATGNCPVASDDVYECPAEARIGKEATAHEAERAPELSTHSQED